MLQNSVRRLRGLVRGAGVALAPARDGAPSSLDLHALASKAQSARDWTAARDLWTAAVEQAPNDTNAWIQLGNMLNELADYPAALDAFEKAARLDSSSYDATAGRAGVHERAGSWFDASRAWLDAADLAPGHEVQLAHAFSHAVLAAYHAGDAAHLNRVTMQAIAARPDFLDHAGQLTLRAKLLRIDQPKAAKHLLGEHLGGSPGDDAARFDYASICLEDETYADGLAVLAPVMATAPSSSFLWLAADLHERLRHWHDVLTICDNAVLAGVAEPRFAQRGFDAAVKVGDLDRARRYARQFTRLDKGELRLIDQLRAAYETAGEPDRARLLCRWLCRRWPHSRWHSGQLIILTAGTLGLLAADRLLVATVARDGPSQEVDRAYCLAALTSNEPAEAQRRLEWYLANRGAHDTDSACALGYVLANSAGIAAAENHFLALAARTYQSKNALVGLAHMASRRRDQRATLELWARVSGMFPDDTIARVEHARAIYDSGDHAGARIACERQLRALPTDITMGGFYAWLLVAIGDDATAQSYFPTLSRQGGPSWDLLEAAIHSHGRSGTLDAHWATLVTYLPWGSTRAASSRLYHIVRLLLYFDRPSFAAELVTTSRIDGRSAPWLAPYCKPKPQLTVRASLVRPALAEWDRVLGHVTDRPAARMAAMPYTVIQTELHRPKSEHPVVHIVNKFEQARGGSELHALDLAERIGRYAHVELWSPETPHPHFSSSYAVKAVDRSQGQAPYGGVVVFIGVYFPISWLAFARPDRIIFLYNTFEAPTMYARVAEAARLTGIPVELLFCSDLIRQECQLPGLFEPSPTDIVEFSPGSAGAKRPFTVGRHSRDVMEKHHLGDGAVYRAVAQAGGQSVVLGGTCMRSALSSIPNLQLLPARTVGIADFLRSLDVYFYRTSTWVEPWGRVVVEAMACGVPVLAHGLGGYAQIIRHGENGLLFHTTDEAVSEVKRLEADVGLRQRLGEAARETVETLLSHEALDRLAMFYLIRP